MKRRMRKNPGGGWFTALLVAAGGYYLWKKHKEAAEAEKAKQVQKSAAAKGHQEKPMSESEMPS